MNINSNYNDFYDYVIGIVGIDKERVFYRKERFIDLEDIELVEDCIKVSNLYNGDYDYKTFRDKSESFSEYIEKNGIVNKNHIGVNRKIRYYRSDKNVLDLLFVNSFELFDRIFYELDIKIMMSLLNVGGSLVRGVAITNKSADWSGKRNIDFMFTLNALDKFLSSEIFNKYKNDRDYILSTSYLKYLIKNGVTNGIDKDGFITFGEIKDFMGNGDLIAYNKKIGTPISVVVYEVSDSWFSGKGYVRPEYRVSKNNILAVIASPKLFETGIPSVLDPMQVYQNIDVSIGAMSNIEKNVTFENNVIVESKGFDIKESFRKRKGSNSKKKS